MPPTLRYLAVLASLLPVAAGSVLGAETPSAVPLFTGLGNHHHPITTGVAEAQRYFDQGLSLAWGFNHAEAERSFRAAAALDPGCAMCWWGIALVLGPNINLPMQPDAWAPAYEAIQKAREVAAGASPGERAYVEALARRYGPPPAGDRAALDLAYADAMRALAADDSYATQCRAQGVYPLGYMPHNHHFLWVVALLQGNQRITLEEARLLAERADLEMMRMPDFGWLQQFYVTPLFTDVAFGRWEQALAAPEPEPDLLYPRAIWRYARALALVRTGKLDAAGRELAALERLAGDPALAEVGLGTGKASALVPIAAAIAAGEIAAARADVAAAVAALRDAVAREDGLTYDEPPAWPLPARHNLGAVLLAAGRPAEAQAVFREDLARFPDNGWSLFGLAQSLEAQGRTSDAESARSRFAAAWRDADVDLTGPRL